MTAWDVVIICSIPLLSYLGWSTAAYLIALRHYGNALAAIAQLRRLQAEDAKKDYEQITGRDKWRK